MIMRQWRHFAYNLQEGGIRQVGSKILTKLSDFVAKDVTVVLYRVSVPDYAMKPDLQLTHKIADCAELERINYFKILTFPEMIRERFARGHRCHVFYLDGEFVNLIWENKDAVFFSETHSVRLPDTMGLQDVFTRTEFRRRGINYAAHILIVNYAREAGYKYVVSAIDKGNVASLGTYRKAGYSHFMTVTLKQRFGVAKLHMEPISDS